MSRLIIKPNLAVIDTSLRIDTSLLYDDSASHISGDADWLFVSNAGGSGNLDTFSFNGTTFIPESSINITGTYYGTHRTPDFLFASHSLGIYSYTVDGSGILTEIDSIAIANSCEDVFYDGNFLFASTVYDGSVAVLSLSVDPSGFMTEESSTGSSLLGNNWGITSDGSSRVFLSSNQASGTSLSSFQYDPSGIVSFIDAVDSSNASFANYTKVVYYNNKLFSAGALFEVFDIDSSGFLDKSFTYSDFGSPTNGRMVGIDIDNQYIYLTSWGLVTVSLTVLDKEPPYDVVATAYTPSYAYDVYVRSQQEIFVASLSTVKGLYNYEFFDVLSTLDDTKLKIIPGQSTTSSLTEINSLLTGTGAGTYEMEYDGQFLYIAGATLGLQVYHYDDINGFTLDSSVAGNFRGLHKSTNFLFASEQTGGNIYSYTVDVSGNLTQVDIDTIPQNPRGIVASVDETKLYVSETAGRISIWDISTNGSFTFQANYTLDASVPVAAGNMLIDGSILHYVTIDGVSGTLIRAIASHRIASNGTLTYADIFFSDSSANSSRLPQMQVYNNQLYVAMNEFRIFDVDSSGNYTSSFDWLPASNSLIMGLDVDSTNIYLTDSSAGILYTLDTTSPGLPTFATGPGDASADLNIFATSVNNIIGINEAGFLAKYEITSGDAGESSKLKIVP